MYNLVYMKRTNIYLAEDQAAALHQLSQSAGVSQAELVRRLIDQGLADATPDLESDLRAISESFAVFAGGSVRWQRGRDARERHLDQVRGL